jgi:GC-rich sequence DNA-binding factor
LAEEREQLDKKEKEMREMVRKAETKRTWFVAFREWVESVATFLDEKVSVGLCESHQCLF